MKNYLYPAALSLLLFAVSCSPTTPEYSLKPTNMTLKAVDGSLTTSAVKVTINLEDDEHYYYCGIATDSAFRARKSDAAFMQRALDILYGDYWDWKVEAADSKDVLYTENTVWGEASFASHCLKYGNDYLTFSDLESDTHYVIYCFCVDPQQHSPIGNLFSLDVTTKKWSRSNLSFTVSFTDNNDIPFITVVPSNDEDSYIWDFPRVSLMDEDYKGNVSEYLIDELNMFQYVGWTSDYIFKGFSSRNVSYFMCQPDTFLFIVSGYDGGFTTSIFTDTLIYPFQIDTLVFK